MEGKNATAIKTKPYEQNITTQTCGPFHGPKQHVHFKAYATTPQSVPFLHACVAFISCFKDDTVTLVICYALKCDCCLGLSLCAFKFVYGLHVPDMVLGELRFFFHGRPSINKTCTKQEDTYRHRPATANCECDLGNVA